MPRNAGLMDADLRNEIVDRALTRTQRIDDAAARRISKREKRINMHNKIYILVCIFKQDCPHALCVAIG